jgi:hypothetical protein
MALAGEMDSGRASGFSGGNRDSVYATE